jgi:hypothetical protein
VNWNNLVLRKDQTVKRKRNTEIGSLRSLCQAEEAPGDAIVDHATLNLG